MCGEHFNISVGLAINEFKKMLEGIMRYGLRLTMTEQQFNQGK
jgi:hypothetical protein